MLKTGYAEMRKLIIEDTKFDIKDLPTYQMLKNRPKLSCLSITPLNSHANDVKFAGYLTSNFDSLPFTKHTSN